VRSLAALRFWAFSAGRFCLLGGIRQTFCRSTKGHPTTTSTTQSTVGTMRL
jgi:hypothetical protein